MGRNTVHKTVHQSPSSEELECPWRSFSMIRLLEGALVISVNTKVGVSFDTWRMTVQDARSSMWKPAWRWTSCWRTGSAVWSPKNCNKKNTCFLVRRCRVNVPWVPSICFDRDEGTYSFPWRRIDEIGPVSSSPQREADFFSTADELQQDDTRVSRLNMHFRLTTRNNSVYWRNENISHNHVKVIFYTKKIIEAR